MLCTIIGAGPGLGSALARRFASEGCAMALVARTTGSISTTAAQLDESGHAARAFIADASDPPSLDRAFEEIRQWRGPTDILIYNAAAMVPGQASELDAARIVTEMAVNLGGAVTAVANVLPAMRDRKRGTIIFTGGGLALEPYPEWTSLAAGKAALRAYALALHKEMAAEDVHVAVVAVCGIIEANTSFDPGRIADIYWQLHAQPSGSFSKEIVYLPVGADPYYNDPRGLYRHLSDPIVAKGF